MKGLIHIEKSKFYCANIDNKPSYGEIYQVAHMYYELGMLQSEISERLFYSRSKVSRLLKQAHETGIVQITVKKVFDRTESVEQKLCSTFKLKDAVVITDYCENAEDSLDALTDFAAIYISKLLVKDCVVGITRGTTINKLIDKLSNVNNAALQIVQLMGASFNSYQSEESHELVNRMLHIFNGRAYFLNTPLYVNDLYAKNILLQDNTVKTVFEKMDECDIVLTGIGALNSTASSSRGQGYMTLRHLQELHKKKAVGSICSQYFDINGMPIPCEWNAKCMAMPLESIDKRSLSIGIAQGRNKVSAILGALRGHHINILITNVSTATEVIELHEKRKD